MREWTLGHIPTSHLLSRSGKYLCVWNDPFFSDSTVPMVVYTNTWDRSSRRKRDLEEIGAENMIDFMEDNEESYQEPKNWGVSQVNATINKPILQQFAGVPLDLMYELWRKPLNPKKLNLSFNHIQSYTVIHVLYNQKQNKTYEFDFNFCGTWDKWFNISTDRGDIFMRWLREDCKHGINLFSDSPHFFESPEDQLSWNRYIKT